jgi:hypothetical protein
MKAPMSKQASQLYEFGPFRVDPRECLLLRDGEALALTPKAFEAWCSCRMPATSWRKRS